MGRGMDRYSSIMQIEPFSSDRRIRRMSLEEWVRLSEDERGEWLDGWLVEEEMGSYLHDLIVGWFIAALRGWIVPLGGSVTASDMKFIVAATRGHKPDVSVFFPGNRPSIDAAAVTHPPDIAIEVVCSSPRDQRRDRLEKVEDYAAFGVSNYWIVDPLARTLEILELGPEGRYVHALGAASGATAPPNCPGLTLDLDALWREVDSHAK